LTRLAMLAWTARSEPSVSAAAVSVDALAFASPMRGSGGLTVVDSVELAASDDPSPAASACKVLDSLVGSSVGVLMAVSVGAAAAASLGASGLAKHVGNPLVLA